MASHTYILNNCTNELTEVLVVLLCICSMFGSLYIILSYQNKFSYKLVALLGINDFMLMLSLIGFPYDDQNDTACKVQAFFVQYFGMSIFFWPTVICFNIFITVVHQVTEIDRFLKHYIIFANFVPLVVSFIPLIADAYGQSGYWCWIKIQKSNYMFIQYGTVWVFIGFNIYMLIKTAIYLKHDQHVNFNSKKTIFKMLQFPAIQIICWTPACIHRIYNQITTDDNQFLDILNLISIGIQGILNAIVYGGLIEKKIFGNCCFSGCLALDFCNVCRETLCTTEQSQNELLTQNYDLQYQQEQNFQNLPENNQEDSYESSRNISPSMITLLSQPN